jgi:hypothetical protein
MLDYGWPSARLFPARSLGLSLDDPGIGIGVHSAPPRSEHNHDRGHGPA